MIAGIFGFILGVILTIVLAFLALFGIGTATGDFAPAPEIADEPAVVMAGDASQLVDAAWLRDQMAVNPALLVVALMPEEQFADGHIPGAVQINRADLAITDTAEATIDAWEKDVETLLTGIGLTWNTTVVVYDDGSHDAARLWWVLTQLSHPSVAILDGGLESWSELGEPVETGPSNPTPSPLRYNGIPSISSLATKETVEASLDDPSVVIVDARPANEYAAGHIPGAINIPLEQNYSPADGALLPIDELQSLYIDAGITPDKQVIVYCNSGVRASSDFFALTYLGYPDVALYAGSWPEWSSDPALPVEQ